MAVTHEQTIAHPNSSKQIYAIPTFRRWCFAWTPVVSGVYPLVIPLAFDVSAMTETGVDMGEDSSLANLIASDTSSVGRFFWDLATTTLHVKPKSGDTALQHHYLAWCVLHWSEDGSVATVPAGGSDAPFHSRILRAPPMTQAESPVFSGAVDRISTGSLNIANTDGMVNDWGFEPDGEVQFYTINGIFASG